MNGWNFRASFLCHFRIKGLTICHNAFSSRSLQINNRFGKSPEARLDRFLQPWTHVQREEVFEFVLCKTRTILPNETRSSGLYVDGAIAGAGYESRASGDKRPSFSNHEIQLKDSLVLSRLVRSLRAFELIFEKNRQFLFEMYLNSSFTDSKSKLNLTPQMFRTLKIGKIFDLWRLHTYRIAEWKYHFTR